MTDAVAAALDAVYLDPNASVEIAWTPAGGGGPYALRALRRSAEPGLEIAGLGKRNTATNRIRVRVAEVAALNAGALAKDDKITLDGVDLYIVAEPRRDDKRRLQWSLELAK